MQKFIFFVQKKDQYFFIKFNFYITLKKYFENDNLWYFIQNQFLEEIFSSGTVCFKMKKSSKGKWSFAFTGISLQSH